MKKLKFIFLLSALYFVQMDCCLSQTRDTTKQGKENSVHVYFIISAGDKINAYFNDKPLAAETVLEFNEYVQANVKTLRDSWVVISGKPKTGTFDDVIKILNRYRFKHITKNISKD